MKLLLDASEMLAESASPAPDTVTNPDHELLIITAVCSTLISVSGLIMAAMLCSWCFGRKKYDSDEEENLNEYKPVVYGGEDSSSIRDSSITPNHSPSHNGSAQSRASSTQHLTSVGNKKSSRFDRHKTVTEHVQPLNNTNQGAHVVAGDTVAFTQQKEKPNKEMETKVRSQQNHRHPFIPIDTQTRSLQNQQHPSISIDTQDIQSVDGRLKSNRRKGSLPIIVPHKQPKQNQRRPSIPIEMVNLDTQHINIQDDCPKDDQRKGSLASIQSSADKAYNISGLNESKETSEQCVIEEEVPCTMSLIPQTKDIKKNSNPGEEEIIMKSKAEDPPLRTTYKSSWHHLTNKLPLIVAHKRPKENEQRPPLPIEMVPLGTQDINSQDDCLKPNPRKGSLASIQDKACNIFSLHESRKGGEHCVIKEEVPGTSSQIPQTKGVRKNSLPADGTNNMKSKDDHHPLPSTYKSLWHRVKLKLPLILALRRPKEYSAKRRASMFASREDFLRHFSSNNDPQRERKSHPNKNDPKSKNILRRFSLGNQPTMKVEPPESPAQVSNVQQLISMFKEKIQEETTKPARQLCRESRHKVKRLKRKYLEQEKIKRYANSPFYVAPPQSAKDVIPPKTAAENVAPEKTDLTAAQENTQRVINNLRRGSRVMTEEEKQNAYVNLIKRRREVQRMRKQYMQRTGHSVEVDSYECDPPIPADVSL